MNTRYGAPPAPPPGAFGNIPTQRLPTQINQFDTAPSCVQNAMMTKDKKPFTYTPGGIDLSQIKSPKMAKRIARNAQNEGVTGQPKQSPLAKPNGTENGNHSPSISMGAAAMGMPFQVFPTPPPPQPPTQARTNVNIPPPPPPSNLSAPTKPAANNARKSPTPQSFEPPPMGFRPEIKIPTNPMAALKKVPKPQEKNDFWVEEYKKERSKSPMVERKDSPQTTSQNVDNENNNIQENNNNNIIQKSEYKPEEIHTESQSNGKIDTAKENERNEKVQEASIVTGVPIQRNRDEVDQSQTPVYRRSFETQQTTQPAQVFNNNIQNSTTPKVFQSQPPSPKPASNGVPSPAASPAVQGSPKPVYNSVPSPAPSASSQESPKPIFKSVTPPTDQTQFSPRPQTGYNTQSPSLQTSNNYNSPSTPQPTAQSQPSPRPQVIYNNVTRDTMSPFNRGTSPQPQFGGRDAVKSPVQQSYQTQKNAQVGSIYIPPVPAENLAYKTPTPAVPNYIQQENQNEENSRPRQSTPLRWMATRPNTKEQPEWAKEDNVTPSTVNRPQSMYKPQNLTSNQPQQQQTINNGNFSTTSTYQQTPNHSLASNAGLKLQIQSGGNQPKERIIPIQLEQTPTKTPESPFANYSPRPQAAPQSAGATFAPNPNQFVDQGYNNFMSSKSNPNQARVIPIAIDKGQGDGPFNNSTRGPVSSTPVVIQNNSRGNNATATGNTTPNQSKSFRILQKITSTEDGNEDLINEMNQPAELQRPHYSRQMMATPQQQTNNAAIEQLNRMQQNHERGRQGPPMKYPQPPTYVQQRAPYQNDNEQYIPPSQQQAPEPKMYSGSAIPSRSFKLLQAMTTPENAVSSTGVNSTFGRLK